MINIIALCFLFVQEGSGCAFLTEDPKNSRTQVETVLPANNEWPENRVGEQPVAMQTGSTDAEAIIEKTARLYQQWKGMSVSFAANVRSDANGVSESFEGTIRMKKDKFVLQTPDMITWFDGATQWTYMPRNEEVNVNTPSGSDLRYLNPMLLLNDYKKDFTVSFIGESTSANAKSAYDIAFIPKKKDDIEKIELQIEKHTALPAKIVVTMRHDIRSVFTIRTIREEAFDDSIFTFPEADYPEAELIDLS